MRISKNLLATGACITLALGAALTTSAAAINAQTGKTAQTITFTSKAPVKAYADGDYTPTAKTSSGLPVTFTIDAKSTRHACSLDKSKLIILSGVGTCIVDANQAGNAKYAPAKQVQLKFTIQAITGGLG